MTVGWLGVITASAAQDGYVQFDDQFDLSPCGNDAEWGISAPTDLWVSAPTGNGSWTLTPPNPVPSH